MKIARCKRKPALLLTAAVAVVAITATAKTFASNPSHIDYSAETSSAAVVTESTTKTETETETTQTTAIQTTKAPTTAATTKATTVAETDNTERLITLPRWTMPKKVQDKSYFDDAIFVGDSRQEDFVMYMDLPKENCYSDVGLSVTTAYTKEFVEMNGKKLTAIEAVKQNKSFKKAYLMFGINEMGWPYPKEFIKAYGKIIDSILQANPKAVIYVQSILPITEKLDAENGEVTNKKIKEINAMLKELAKEKNVVYLDVASAVADENGCLPAYAAQDGIHMGKKLCVVWYDYLLKNTYKPSVFG